MTYVVTGKNSSFLIKNLKFGKAYNAEDFKKIKLFDCWETAWECAEKHGCIAESWNSFLDGIARERAETRNHAKRLKKNLFENADWRESPDVTWVLKEEPQHYDLRWFTWFKPKRMLVSKGGVVLAVEGYTPEVPCVYTYDHEELDLLEEVYTIKEQSK